MSYQSSADQAAIRLRDGLTAEILLQGISHATIADRLGQPVEVVAEALSDQHDISVWSAAMIAHAMGCRLVPSGDGYLDVHPDVDESGGCVD